MLHSVLHRALIFRVHYLDCGLSSNFFVYGHCEWMAQTRSDCEMSAQTLKTPRNVPLIPLGISTLYVTRVSEAAQLVRNTSGAIVQIGSRDCRTRVYFLISGVMLFSPTSCFMFRRLSEPRRRQWSVYLYCDVYVASRTMIPVEVIKLL